MSTLLRRYGMAPSAWQVYLNASAQAGIDLTEHPKLRVTQSIGNAAASKGFHARDGYVKAENGERVPYCACTDFSVLWLSIDEIRAWVSCLAWWGFAAWYRHGGNWAGNTHIHAVYAGLPMKEPAQRQVSDYLNNRTGLVGHARETFYTGNAAQDAYIRALFNWANNGGPKPPPAPHAPLPAPKPEFAVQNGFKLLLGKSDRVLTTMPLVDGHALCPVRDWFSWLGIPEEAVVWNPARQTVTVQGRELKTPVRKLKIGGVETGFEPIRELVEFSGTLALQYDGEKREVRVTRKA